MFEINQINYTNGIDLKEVIKNINVDHTDQSLLVYDLEKLNDKYQTWKKYLPLITPYYAVKCNDDNHVLKTLAALGVNFDCASENEIKKVLDLGVDPERIIFAHPYKPIAHLEFAKKKNVKFSTVDTEFEIYKIHKTYPESNLIIRFRCEAEDALYPLGDKFGCDVESDAASLIMLAKSLNLKVIGTSFHVGSGCNDFPAYERAITTAKTLFEFGSFLGFHMYLLDIGGGFPGNDDRTFQIISEIINKSLLCHFPENNVKVIAEPGRFLAATVNTLICKIQSKREIRSPNGKLLTKLYYLNDGIYGSFNIRTYDHKNVVVKHFLEENGGILPHFRSVLFGPTCDSFDKIGDTIQLPDLKRGDFLAFPNMGAYTVPMACEFNGFKIPNRTYFQKSNSP